MPDTLHNTTTIRIRKTTLIELKKISLENKISYSKVLDNLILNCRPKIELKNEFVGTQNGTTTNN